VLDELERVPAVPGVARVLVPGDVERESRARRAAEGIPVPEATWQDLAAIAARFGVPLPRL